jgi:hypothetical protein
MHIYRLWYFKADMIKKQTISTVLWPEQSRRTFKPQLNIFSVLCGFFPFRNILIYDLIRISLRSFPPTTVAATWRRFWSERWRIMEGQPSNKTTDSCEMTHGNWHRQALPCTQAILYDLLLKSNIFINVEMLLEIRKFCRYNVLLETLFCAVVVYFTSAGQGLADCMQRRRRQRTNWQTVYTCSQGGLIGE